MDHLHFHSASGFSSPNACAKVRLLGPCFKTGHWKLFCQNRERPCQTPSSNLPDGIPSNRILFCHWHHHSKDKGLQPAGDRFALITSVSGRRLLSLGYKSGNHLPSQRSSLPQQLTDFDIPKHTGAAHHRTITPPCVKVTAKLSFDSER